jgi:hypothetical protein
MLTLLNGRYATGFIHKEFSVAYFSKLNSQKKLKKPTVANYI